MVPQPLHAPHRFPAPLTLVLSLALTPLAAAAPPSRCAAPSVPQEPSQKLKQARDKLFNDSEGETREGARACLAMDDVPAVEALLEVLDWKGRPSRGHLAEAHYRDVVWESLIQIKDPYARQRVEVELQDSKNALQRQWCAQLLGIYGDAEFAPTLVKALRDKEEDVVRAAVRSLGQMRAPQGAKPLGKFVRSKNIYVRANAIEALARIDPVGARETFGKGLEDKDGGVRCALLGAAREIYPAELEAFSTAALEDEDWRPRMQAVENLSGVRTKTAVDRLIVAIGDGRPVVGLRAIDSLQRLTREKFTRADQWERWWADQRETFAFPEGEVESQAAQPEYVVTYNGLRLVSDHVAFIIDKSKAMSEHLTEKKSRKDDAALAELEQVLTTLQGRLVFNVFTYEQNVREFEDAPVKLTAKTAKQALEFVAKVGNSGSKDIWKVLELVCSDPTLDTAYLLSSGEPDVGKYVHHNRVTEHLRDLNRFHKIVVHTVAYSDNTWYRDQLEKISEATGGEFAYYQ